MSWHEDDEPDDEYVEPDNSGEDDGEDDEPSVWASGLEEDGDFPEEEEDEDNPDPYRIAEPDEQPGDDDAAEDFAMHDGDDGWWRPAHAAGAEVPSGVGFGSPDRHSVTGLDLLYDDAGYYGYVLVRCANGALAEGDRRAVETALRHVVRVVAGGRSFQPASDGLQYAWYFRVQGPRGSKPDRRIVDEVLAPFRRPARQLGHSPGQHPRSEEGGVLARRLADLEARLGLERERGGQLARDLVRVQAGLALATEREARLARELRDAEDDFVARVRQLLERDRARLPREEYDAVVARLADAQARLEAARRQLDGAFREQREFADAFDGENARLRDDVRRLGGQVSALEAQLAAAHEEREARDAELLTSRGAQPVARSRTDLRAILGAALPGVEFLRGSLDVMLVELSDPRPVLTLIGGIVTRGACAGQEKVSGAAPWLKARYRTGQSDDGRLYFARRPAGDGWKVLVSRKTAKTQQERDIAYLRTAGA